MIFNKSFKTNSAAITIETLSSNMLPFVPSQTKWLIQDCKVIQGRCSLRFLVKQGKFNQSKTQRYQRLAGYWTNQQTIWHKRTNQSLIHDCTFITATATELKCTFKIKSSSWQFKNSKFTSLLWFSNLKIVSLLAATENNTTRKLNWNCVLLVMDIWFQSSNTKF